MVARLTRLVSRAQQTHHGLLHGAKQHQVRERDLVADHIHPRLQVLVDLREQYTCCLSLSSWSD